MRFYGTLLLAAAAAGGAGTAHAAGTDFQYVGSDDKVHAVHGTDGCHPASGGGAQGVVNRTGREARLYATPDCSGAPVARIADGAAVPVGPYFGSVDFRVTG
ncbi:hypothetical protein [Streptomyces sp. NBC_00239]|uniref:hypothetical protein n=1 Tax=Streptomyces sp. NBC_00239 TaxID=2903640 RepID=UPI002E2C15AF|nr:hypothetical protein [Streptomyces sp. NBC_00239]